MRELQVRHMRVPLNRFGLALPGFTAAVIRDHIRHVAQVRD